MENKAEDGEVRCQQGGGHAVATLARQQGWWWWTVHSGVGSVR